MKTKLGRLIFVGGSGTSRLVAFVQPNTLQHPVAVVLSVMGDVRPADPITRPPDRCRHSPRSLVSAYSPDIAQSSAPRHAPAETGFAPVL